MGKIILTFLSIIIISLCGCSDEAVEEVNNTPPNSRALSATTVVWQAQPGEINIPLGQAVTINTDGSIIK